MTFNRPQSRNMAYLKVPGLGFQSIADSIQKSPPTVTDASQWQNASWGPKQLSQRLLYRANFSNDDRVKATATLAGAVLSLYGLDYLDNTDLSYEFLGMMHPDELNECLRKAQRRVKFKGRRPISLWDDGDFGLSTVTSFPTLSGATRVKDATQADEGAYALVVTNSGANGYVQGNPKKVAAGDLLYSAAIGQVAGAGTLVFQVVNYDTGAVLNELTTTESEMQHLWDVITVPSGCERVAPRLGARENLTVTVWDSLPSHNLNNKRPIASTLLHQDWQLIDLSTAVYERNYTSNRDMNDSRRYQRWKRDTRSLQNNAALPNSVRWIFNRDGELPRNDLWYYAFLLDSDRSQLIDETSVTYAVEEFWEPAIIAEIASFLSARFPEEGLWPKMVADAELTLEAQMKVDDDSDELAAGDDELVHYGGRL